jgi:hypothetical protein
MAYPMSTLLPHGAIRFFCLRSPTSVYRRRNMSVEFRAFCAFPEASLTGNTILSQTILKILEGRTDSPDYLHFLGWTHFWGAIFHWIMTTLNCPSRVLVDVIRERDLLSGCNFVQYVTVFSFETLGFYVLDVLPIRHTSPYVPVW